MQAGSSDRLRDAELACKPALGSWQVAPLTLWQGRRPFVQASVGMAPTACPERDAAYQAGGAKSVAAWADWRAADACLSADAAYLTCSGGFMTYVLALLGYEA